MKFVIKNLFAAMMLAAPMASFAQIVSYQVLNNQVLYTASTTTSASITSSDKSLTVYVKTGGAVPQDSYNVYLQTSPDNGVTWSTVPSNKIFIARSDTIGSAYQMNVDVKATKMRLQVGGANSNAVFPVTLSAWIVF